LGNEEIIGNRKNIFAAFLKPSTTEGPLSHTAFQLATPARPRRHATEINRWAYNRLSYPWRGAAFSRLGGRLAPVLVAPHAPTTLISVMFDTRFGKCMPMAIGISWVADSAP